MSQKIIYPHQTILTVPSHGLIGGQLALNLKSERLQYRVEF
jgi:hypothetical protein